MNRISLPIAQLSILAAIAMWAPVSVADEATFELKIHNHRFEPETVTVPANKRVRLVVRNADATPEEFESYRLNREKVIPGGGTAIIYVGPLDPGTYPFIGEFHEATAKGRIVAK